MLALVYVFTIWCVATVLYVIVNELEPNRPLATVLQFLILAVGAAAIVRDGCCTSLSGPSAPQSPLTLALCIRSQGMLALVYVFTIWCVATVLYVIVNELEPNRPLATVLQFLILAVGAAAIVRRLLH